MKQAQIASGIRILGSLLLAGGLFLAAHKLFERTIFSLVQPMGSSHAASGGSIVPRPAHADPLAVTGWTLSTLFLAALLALPLSVGLLSFYRRAVVKSMRSRVRNSPGEPPGVSNSAKEPNSAIPEFVTMDHLSAAALPAEARRLLSDLTISPWMTAAVYALAGLGFALMTAVFVLISDHARISAMRLIALTWLYMWPAALVVNLVAATTGRMKVITVSVYFIVYMIVSAIAVAVSPSLTWGQILGLWVIENLFPTVLLMIFANRRVRAVGPLVLLLMILAVYGAMTAPFLLFSSHTESLTRLAADLLGGSLAFNAAEVLGFAFFGIAGWFALQYVRRAYEKKKLSDQTIVLGAVWLQFAVFWFINLSFEGYAWVISIIPAFIVYLLIVRTGFALLRLRTNSSNRGCRLLVLRVFALGKQSERLFEALGKHWRYVASITQIAGPDLIKTTVQPHEFLDFMSGKLSRRFIDGPEKLQARLSEADNASDADGRFRVNDFFCYDDTWKFVLDRLVRGTDAVLMDLRGFSPQNAGCVFEIDELIDVVPIERVVFIVDGTTHESFLRETMTQSWSKTRPTSPNRRHRKVHLLRFGGVGHGDLQDLLTALCAATEAVPMSS